MNGKRKVSKIAIRMTALFLVVVLPLTIFATVGYLENRASLERKTLEGIHQKARQTADTMEEHMWNIFNAHSALNVDEKIMYMIGSHDYLDNYQRYSNMRNVFERISSIKLILPAIREIRLHVPSLQRTFYSNWTATKLTEECQYYMDHIDRFYTIRTGENTLTLACGYPWLAEHKYRYYLVTDIDCEALKNGVLERQVGKYDHIYLYRDDGQEMPDLITCCGDRTLFAPFTQEWNKEDEEGQIRLGNDNYLVAMEDIGFFGLKVLLLTPEERVFGELHAQSRMMYASLILTLFLILYFVRVILQMINIPLHKLTDAFAQLEQGHLGIQIEASGKDEFADIFERFNRMSSRMKHLFDDSYHSKLLVQEIKLRQLQAQVNPHFLYNSFRNIYAMAQMEDYEGILEITDKLSAFYRYTSKNIGENVFLCQEDEYARAYLGIQRMRFEDRLEVRLETLPEELKEAPASHFSIQTIVENACKYALPTQPDRAVIALAYSSHPDGYAVTVDDNGTAMTDEKIAELNRVVQKGDGSNSGTGLVHLHERLRIRWGENAGLSFSRSELGGLQVKMYVYWKRNREAEE